MSEEFELKKRDYHGENNPNWKGINTKDMTNHEKYLRYKDTIKRNNKKNYKKYKFGKYVKNYADKNTKKINAKARAIYNFPIPKDKLCENCQINFATQRHHEDYSKPLEIIFVCRACHGELDRLRRIKENGK